MFNTGAFQRIEDEPGFLQRAKTKNLTPAQALRVLSPEDLPPCYTAVVIGFSEDLPEAETIRWQMPEGGTGRFVDVGDVACK